MTRCVFRGRNGLAGRPGLEKKDSGLMIGHEIYPVELQSPGWKLHIGP